MKAFIIRAAAAAAMLPMALMAFIGSVPTASASYYGYWGGRGYDDCYRGGHYGHRGYYDRHYGW